MTNPTFISLGVPEAIAAALEATGKTEPFPIQRDTLPDTLAGRDVLGRGRTGSGKTIAFGIPLVTRLADDANAKRRPFRPRGLVLAPTRELVTQIAETISVLAKPMRVRVTTIFGGVPQRRQEVELERGVDIVVAAPGRLDDLMKQGVISLDDIEVTVLDEADHMADMGFLPVVTRILQKTPRNGQRLLFSATLDNGVDQLVKRFLSNPVMHSVDPAESPVAQMTHHVFNVADKDVKDEVIEALASGTGKRILFTRMKHQAKRLAQKLTKAGIPAVELQGNLSQNARERNLAEFSSGQAKVLVATDVAARGIHVDGVELVVHIDPPVEHKAYLHRSGRTARAGSEGDVVTICLPEQQKEMRQLMKMAKIQATPQSVTPADEAVTGLIGEVAPRVDPSEVLARRHRATGQNQAGQGKSQGANAQRKRARKRSPQDAQQQGSAHGGSQGSGRESNRTPGRPRQGGSQHSGSRHGGAQPGGAGQRRSQSRRASGR